MKVISEIRADKVSFGAGNILFVEGRDSSLDVSVLGRILPLSVKPLGTSFTLRSAAEAFASVCPTYFFIIDRDHVSDEDVERYWRDFPRSDTPNLLIWRKKELESYFLDPKYLMQSEWFDGRRRERELRDIILKTARRILYISAANLVIERVRDVLKRKWIEQFTNVKDFRDAKAARKLLLSRNEFRNQKVKFEEEVRPDSLTREFDRILEDMTGGREPLEWNHGRWLDLLPAKEMLNAVMQSSCFKVKAKANGRCLSGEDKKQAVIESLLKDGIHLPEDFVKLREILNTRALSA